QPLDEQEKDSEFVQTVTTAKEFERMQIGMPDIDKNPQLTLQRGERAYGFNGEGSDDDMPPPSAHPDRHQQRRPSLESTGGDVAEIGAANGKQKGTDAAGQAATQQGNSSSATTGGTLAELDGKTSTILGVSKALYDFQAENPSELTFYENDRLYILYKQCEGWLVGYKGNQIGLIPENYVEFIS
ncbi:HOG (high osmolarity glycerol) pathway protein, partial [Spiromyces aspiralis]